MWLRYQPGTEPKLSAYPLFHIAAFFLSASPHARAQDTYMCNTPKKSQAPPLRIYRPHTGQQTQTIASPSSLPGSSTQFETPRRVQKKVQKSESSMFREAMGWKEEQDTHKYKLFRVSS
jgi:hypothetical protein